MYGPRYVWMVLGTYTGGWQTRPQDGVLCTSEELLIATEGYLAVGFSYYNQGTEVGRCGMVRLISAKSNVNQSFIHK